MRSLLGFFCAAFGLTACFEESPLAASPSVTIPPSPPQPKAAQAASSSAGASSAAKPAAKDDGPLECPPDMARTGAVCMDKTEVTVDAYRRCVARGACTAPSTTANNSDDPQGTPKYSSLCNGLRNDRSRHPVNCVTQQQAIAFCQDVGRRIPSAKEWELAATGGTSGQKYPWGDDPPSANRLNACDSQCIAFLRTVGPRWVSHQKWHRWDDGFAGTAPVGSFERGASLDGVLDLAGNVSEWVVDSGSTTERGSSFSDAEELLVSSFARSPAKTMTAPVIGFRCVAGAKELREGTRR